MKLSPEGVEVITLGTPLSGGDGRVWSAASGAVASPTEAGHPPPPASAATCQHQPPGAALATPDGDRHVLQDGRSPSRGEKDPGALHRLRVQEERQGEKQG